MSHYTDVSAWICYLIIAVIGAIVSFYHVNSKLHGAKILWFRIELWVVYLLYVLFPLVLFWLLDASGEVRDTSLLWAVFIALVYRKILGGESDQLKAPNVLSGYWVSLENLIEKLIENWGESVHKFNQWQHRAIQRRLCDVDKAKLVNLVNFSQRLKVTVADSIIRAAKGDACVDRQDMINLSEKIYIAAMKEYRNEIPNIFIEEKILSNTEVFLRCKFQLRQIITTVLLTAVLIASSLLLLHVIHSESFNPKLDYYVWRIGKSNTSEKDVHRNTRIIVGLMKDPTFSASHKQYIVSSLLGKLYGVDVSAERARKIANMLIELRDHIVDKDQFFSELAGILRTDRFEIRVIVQSSLLLFATSYDKRVPDELAEANVYRDMKISETEQLISRWVSLK